MSNPSTGVTCQCNYECLTKWTRIITFSVSLTVIALGIQKFFNVFSVVYVFGYIINVYLM